MLGGDPFRHDLIRKYTVLFGTLFNEIRITRLDRDGGEDQLIRVPCSFAQKEKILARVHADPDIDRPAATVLPRITYEFTSMAYNPDNKLSSSRHHSREVAGDEKRQLLNPVPYDLRFTLWVFTKYMEDGNQIIEQILPYFTPSFTVRVDLFEGVSVDCPIRLNGCVPQDLYANGKFDDRRATMWTLDFTVTAYMFGPVRTMPRIKFARTDLFGSVSDRIRDDIGGLGSLATVTVQPGMDEEGRPTDDPVLTIPYTDIDRDDDWDYVVQVTEP